MNHPSRKTDRNAEMKKLHMGGLSYTVIAEMFGVSVTRAMQVVKAEYRRPAWESGSPSITNMSVRSKNSLWNYLDGTGKPPLAGCQVNGGDITIDAIREFLNAYRSGAIVPNFGKTSARELQAIVDSHQSVLDS